MTKYDFKARTVDFCGKFIAKNLLSRILLLGLKNRGKIYLKDQIDHKQVSESSFNKFTKNQISTTKNASFK